MTKTRIVFLLFLAGLAGALTGDLLLPFLVRVNFLNSGSLLAKISKPAVVISKVEEKIVTVPRSGYFLEAINKISPAAAAVQSFSGGRQIRSGGGVVLTQDGLVAAPASVVPAGASVFQVVLQGKVESAVVVSRDFSKNLALLSLRSDQSKPVVSLKEDLPDLAQSLLVFSKRFNLGKETSFVQLATVSQTDEASGKVNILTEFDQFLFGAAVVNENGEVLGLLDFRNQKPLLISGRDIKTKLDSYLKSAFDK